MPLLECDSQLTSKQTIALVKPPPRAIISHHMSNTHYIHTTVDTLKGLSYV